MKSICHTFAVVYKSPDSVHWLIGSSIAHLHHHKGYVMMSGQLLQDLIGLKLSLIPTQKYIFMKLTKVYCNLIDDAFTVKPV